MYKITLKSDRHKGRDVVQVHFPYSLRLLDEFELHGDFRFSKTMQCWYYFADDFNLRNFFTRLQPYAWIDYSEVSQSFDSSADKKVARPLLDRKKLRESQRLALERTEELLELKNYSPRTVKVYSSVLAEFFHYYADKDPLDIEEGEIKEYLLYQIRKRRVAIATQNQVINGIKFYYEKVEKLERKTYYVERPMKPIKLPEVLSAQEVQRILDSTTNIKHKAILSTIYAGGLRIGEVLSLRINDILTDNKRIFIRGGKGRKDRLTLLSDKLLILLRTYYKEYRPKKWLFESTIPGRQYSPTSVRLVLKTAADNAGIKRRVKPHMLRHSFATHMMERGTDIRLIQELLGHNTIKTTEIYTHVSNNAINNLKSPLDYDD